MNKKIYPIILSLLFTAALLVPFVHAGALVTIYSNPTSTSNDTLITVAHPSQVAGVSAVAVIFNATGTGYLTSVDFSLWKAGYPTGYLTAYFAKATLNVTDGTDYPSTIIEQSTSNISAADIPYSAPAWITFQFNQSQLITTNEVYAIYVIATSYSGSGIIFDRSGAINNESSAIWHNNGWDYPSGDYLIRVYGNTEQVEGGATPAPTATQNPAIPYPDSSGIGAIVNYLIALFIILLPAGILGVLFRFGSWGFITGLAIGAGLGYVLMPTTVPLWLFFAVVLGIVGMMIGPKVTSHGETE